MATRYTYDKSLRVLIHAARRFAQEIADDPEPTKDDKQMEREILAAIAWMEGN